MLKILLKILLKICHVIHEFSDGVKGLTLILLKLIYLNFQPLEFVSRYRDPQSHVVENYSYLFNLKQNIYKS